MTPIDVARTQVGIAEATGQNDGIPAERYMRGDQLAWCAGFVLWCHDVAGHEVPGNYWRLRSVAAFEAEMSERGLWLGPSVVPMSGDIVFFGDRARSDAGVGRHCGLVEFVAVRSRFESDPLHPQGGRVILTGTEIHTIEGNSGNAVTRQLYLHDDKRITGYARVP